MLAVILGSVLFWHPCFLVFLHWWCLAVPWDRCKNCKQMIPFHSMFSGKPCVTSTAHWQRSVPEQHGHPHQHEPRVPTHGVATATTAALAKQVAPTLLLFSFSLSLLYLRGVCWLLFGWPGLGGGGGGMIVLDMISSCLLAHKPIVLDMISSCLLARKPVVLDMISSCLSTCGTEWACIQHHMTLPTLHPPLKKKILWDGIWTPHPLPSTGCFV